jgi:hypothetical protein
VCDLGGNCVAGCGKEHPRRREERQQWRQCRAVGFGDPQLDVVTDARRKRVGVEVAQIDRLRMDAIVDQ